MQASTKDTLIKVTPRRFIPDSETTNVGGLNYETTFVPKEPSAVYQGVSNTTLTSLSFSYDSGTGVLSFTASQSIDDDIFADYDLYFSTDRFFYEEDDPVASTGGVKEWTPRLSANPTFNQTVSNQFFGKLEVTASSVSLLNEDFELNKFLTRYDNYKNKDFRAYAKIGDDFRYLSEGTINTVKAGKVVTFNLKSIVKAFEKTATLGNTQKYYQTNGSDWSGLNFSDEGRPIMNTSGFTDYVPPAVVGPNTFQNPYLNDTANMISATYIGSDQWILGTLPNPPSDGDFIACSYVDNPVVGADTYTRFQITNAADMKYFYQGAGVRQSVGAAVYSDYRYIYECDYVNNRITVANNLGVSSVDRILLVPCHIWKEDNATGRWFLEESYYQGSGTTTTTNILEIITQTATNGDTLLIAESQFLTSVNETDNIKVILQNDQSLDQTDLAQKLIESAGLSIDSASFATAQTEANNQSVINIGRGDSIETIGEIVQRIGNDNNGLFYVNDQSGEIGYIIVNSNLSGVDWTVTSTEILEPELIPTISSRDVYNKINAKNPQYDPSSGYFSGSTESVTSRYSRWFNEEDRILSFKNTNEVLTNSTNDKLDILKNPQYYYRFTLQSDEYYLMQIGEIVLIEDVDNKLLSDETSVEVLIVGLKKSAELVEVTGYVFQEIP